MLYRCNSSLIQSQHPPTQWMWVAAEIGLYVMKKKVIIAVVTSEYALRMRSAYSGNALELDCAQK